MLSYRARLSMNVYSRWIHANQDQSAAEMVEPSSIHHKTQCYLLHREMWIYTIVWESKPWEAILLLLSCWSILYHHNEELAIWPTTGKGRSAPEDITLWNWPWSLSPTRSHNTLHLICWTPPEARTLSSCWNIGHHQKPWHLQLTWWKSGHHQKPQPSTVDLLEVWAPPEATTHCSWPPEATTLYSWPAGSLGNLQKPQPCAVDRLRDWAPPKAMTLYSWPTI